jgi:hypothetical protein
MRGTLAAIAAFFLAQSVAPACLAQGNVGASAGVAPPGGNGPPLVQTGRITYLDPATMNFVCQGRGGTSRYWATRATRVRAGPYQASFYDLRMGQRVEVTFHNSGRLEIADRVILLP